MGPVWEKPVESSANNPKSGLPVFCLTPVGKDVQPATVDRSTPTVLLLKGTEGADKGKGSILQKAKGQKRRSTIYREDDRRVSI